MEALQEAVGRRGGKIVSREVGADGRVRVRCVAGHEWEPLAANILGGSWCAHCYGNAPVEIDAARELARVRGGECLSTICCGNKDKLLWKCGDCGGEWQASWNSVSSKKSWCPRCVRHVREEAARAAFEEALGAPFPKWKAGTADELDGYCVELALAFEHDGIHHEEAHPHFHRTPESWARRQEVDAAKDAWCTANGVALLRVPDRHRLRGVKEIRDFVRAELEARGFELRPAAPLAEFAAKVDGAGKKSVAYLARLAEILEARGETMVSAQCPSRSFPVVVRCVAGHEYATNFDNLERGRGCPECAPSRKKADAEVEELVGRRGFVLCGIESRETGIGEKSRRFRRFLTLRCASHGEFEISLENFQAGKGCSECGRARTSSSRRTDVGTVEAELERLGYEHVSGFTALGKPMRIRCRARGHEEEIAMTALRARVRVAGEACLRCGLAEFGERHGVDGVAADASALLVPQTVCVWTCRACGTRWEDKLRALAMRDQKCRTCKRRAAPPRVRGKRAPPA